MISVLVKASRPKTLTAALVPVLAGTALSHLETDISYSIFLYTLISALLIQIGTNYINDALDFTKGTDTADRKGPARAALSGEISPSALFRAAYVAFILSTIVAIPLVLHGGVPILAIGLTSIFLAYAYTGGPYPLSYNGLGELFVILFFGIIAVTGTYYLQTLTFDYHPVVLGLQIGSLATTLIAINNFRDQHEDKRANKKTLAVRFGSRTGRLIVILSLLVPFLIGFYWIRKVPPAFFLPLLVSPLAFHILLNFISIEPSKKCNKFLGFSALLHLLFGILISVGFVLWS